MRLFKSLPMKALSPCPVRRSFAVWDYNGNGDRHNRTECAVTLKVFISYKSEYRPFARALQTHLKDWGYPTWLDVDNIRPGEYFRHKIQQGLDTSDALVVVLNPYNKQLKTLLVQTVKKPCHFYLTAPAEFDAVLERRKVSKAAQATPAAPATP